MHQSLSWASMPRRPVSRIDLAPLETYAATATTALLEFLAYASFTGTCLALMAAFS